MTALPANEVFAAIRQTFVPYEQALRSVTPEQFEAKPAGEAVWSVGQLLEHICQSAEFLFLPNVRRCLEQRKGQVGGELNDAGKKVLQYNSLPPMKFKIPDKLGAASQPVVQPMAVYPTRLNAILDYAAELVEPILADAGTYKTEHPVLGWMNAAEWFQNFEIHHRHHHRQLDELLENCR